MDLDWYLRRQSGVISRAQARAAGLSEDAVDRRVSRGQWDRLYPGVYLSAHHPYTDEVRLRAAVLWAGKDAVAHGVSAAWWHDLGPDLPATVEVTVRRDRNPGTQAGVVIRRRNLPYPDLIAVRDLWVTDLPLTVLDAVIALGSGGQSCLIRRCNGGSSSLRCTGRTAAIMAGGDPSRRPGCWWSRPTGPPRMLSACWFGCSGKLRSPVGN